MVTNTLSREQIKLKAENVLPLTRPMQAGAAADEGESDVDDSEYDDDDMGVA